MTDTATTTAIPAELQPLLTALEAAEASYNELQTRRNDARALVKALTSDKAQAEAERSDLLKLKLKGNSDQKKQVAPQLAALRLKLRDITDELEESSIALNILDNDEDGLFLDAANDIRTAHNRLEYEARTIARTQYDALKARFPEIVKPLLAELMAWANIAHHGNFGAAFILDDFNLNFVQAAPLPFILPSLPYGLPERPKASRNSTEPKGSGTSISYVSYDRAAQEMLERKRLAEMDDANERDRKYDETQKRWQREQKEKRAREREEERRKQEAQAE